jgi:hypothetical protein
MAWLWGLSYYFFSFFENKFVSRMGVMCIAGIVGQAKAIRKLQHPVRARKLEGFLDHK